MLEEGRKDLTERVMSPISSIEKRKEVKPIKLSRDYIWHFVPSVLYSFCLHSMTTPSLCSLLPSSITVAMRYPFHRPILASLRNFPVQKRLTSARCQRFKHLRRRRIYEPDEMKEGKRGRKGCNERGGGEKGSGSKRRCFRGKGEGEHNLTEELTMLGPCSS